MAKPILVTVAIILDESKENVLLVLGKRDPDNTLYSFPGGVGGFEKYSDPGLQYDGDDADSFE